MVRVADNRERDDLGILWERPVHRRPEPAEPTTVRTADEPVLAEWVATGDSLRDHRLAFRVIGRIADMEELDPARHGPFHREAAKLAIANLRAGKPALRATVVRLARQIQETE